jgi:hypothetical protein
MDRKRWTDFTPKERNRELKVITQSNDWKHLPLNVQENILSLLAEYSGQYLCR